MNMPNSAYYYEKLHGLLSNDEFFVGVTRKAMEMGLPQWGLVGGVIRDLVWGRLTGTSYIEKIRDVDLIYYDSDDCSKMRDDHLSEIMSLNSDLKWSVRNQARMHLRNRDDAYRDLSEAVSKFPETISTIVVRCDESENIYLSSNFGYDDLFNMIFRPTQHFDISRGREKFLQRVERKNWLRKWPDARIAFWPKKLVL